MRRLFPVLVAVVVALACSDERNPVQPKGAPPPNPEIRTFFAVIDTVTPYTSTGDPCSVFAPAFLGHIGEVQYEDASTDYFYDEKDSLLVGSVYDQQKDTWPSAVIAFLNGTSRHAELGDCRYLLEFKKWRWKRDIPNDSQGYSWRQTTESIKFFYLSDTLPSHAEIHYSPKVTYAPVKGRLIGPRYIDVTGNQQWEIQKSDGDGPFTYRWYKSTTGGPPWTLSAAGGPVQKVPPVWTSICSDSPVCSLPIRYGDPDFFIVGEVVDGEGFKGGGVIPVTLYIPSPPAVSADIDGPDTVPEEEDECKEWTAMVSGGTSPFTYTWSGLGSGSSSSIAFSPSNSGWLYLTVTDSQSQQDTDSFWIDVDGEGDCSEG